MVTIADENRVKAKTDWDAIRAEYIAGGISYRELARKHNASEAYLMRKACREHWKQQRDEAVNNGIAISQRKTAEINADRATVASRIKLKLLLRLEKEIDALPELIGSESRNSKIEKTIAVKDKKNPKAVINESTKAYKLKDLTSALKDLTDDMTLENDSGNELLQSLLNLERRSES